MKSQGSTKRKVDKLERYGMPLNDMPKEAFKGQGKIVFAAFRKKFGLLGLIPFALRVFAERRRLLKIYPKEYAEVGKRTSKAVQREFVMLVSMFNAIARKESREKAYEFVQGIFQKLSLQSMPALYQLEDLLQCEGDVFDNFCRFNVAMFQAGDRDYHVQTIEESDNHLRIVVDRCFNVDAGRMFGCPEISKLGCDHDLSGYPPIEEKVQMEFRRPSSMAKGDCVCDFNFYRKGFAPAGDYVNK
jgi:hypothetical protein